MNTQKTVTTLVQNHIEEAIEIRWYSEPNQKVVQLYDALKYKQAPFKKKKSVVHKSELEGAQLIEQQFFLATLAPIWGKTKMQHFLYPTKS